MDSMGPRTLEKNSLKEPPPVSIREPSVEVQPMTIADSRMEEEITIMEEPQGQGEHINT
jgi:hypothetical protein